MSSINGNKSEPYFDSHYLSQEFENNVNSSTTSSPYYMPYTTSMSSVGTPFGPCVAFEDITPIDSSFAVRNNTVFSSFERQSSTSAVSILGNGSQQRVNSEKRCDIDSNDKIEFKILFEYLENLRQNNQIFQTNVLKELKQMREVMTDLHKSIQEMPIRFADALTHCLDSVNGRSDILSVDSEPEIIDVFDKIDIQTNDSKEENSFIEFPENSSKEFEKEILAEKSSSSVDKFVFEYNPYIDLDKWLKRD